MIIKNSRHFRTPRIPQILTSRNTNQSTSSGGAQSVPIPSAATWLLQLHLGQNTHADLKDGGKQELVGCMANVWVMREPHQAGLAMNNHVPQQCRVCRQSQMAARGGTPNSKRFEKVISTSSTLTCTYTRLLQTRYVTAHSVFNHRSGLSLSYQQWIAKFARSRVIPDVHKDTGLDYAFAQLPSNGKEKQNLTFLYWKSGKVLEQAAQGSSGVVRPTGKARFKVLWCLSAEKSERKRNLLMSDHWIDVFQQDLHEHPHTQDVFWCV